jgi:hypothetical protein
MATDVPSTITARTLRLRTRVSEANGLGLAGLLREASVRGDFDYYANHLIATGRVQVTS